MASYLLSCGCGNKLAVEPRQAGERVRCVCGTDLEVPTLRALSQLPRADVPHTAEALWTPRQGLIFLGLVVAAAALCFTAYRFVNRPAPIEVTPLRADAVRKIVNSWSLSESWGYWLMMENGLQVYDDTPQTAAFEQALRSRQRWMLGGAAIAICGLLVAGGAALAGKKVSRT